MSGSVKEINDPQVHDEFEHIMILFDRMKKLEAELDEARFEFRCLLSESSSEIKKTCKKIRSDVEKNKQFVQYVRKLLKETENTVEFEYVTSDNKYKKYLHKVEQETEKNIAKSCLAIRRNLLQLNNLANQHQLQLLPYFEMKAKFIEMFDEKMKQVPTSEYSDLNISMNGDAQLNSSDDIYHEWKFQELLHDERSDDFNTVASNSMTSSYQGSLSSENIYMEHLTTDDMYMSLPANIKITPELVNCTVSCLGNGYLTNHNSNDVESSIEDLSSTTSQDNISFADLFSENKSNGFHYHKELSNNAVSKDLTTEVCAITDKLPNVKADSETCISDLKNCNDGISDVGSLTSSDISRDNCSIF